MQVKNISCVVNVMMCLIPRKCPCGSETAIIFKILIFNTVLAGDVRKLSIDILFGQPLGKRYKRISDNLRNKFLSV